MNWICDSCGGNLPSSELLFSGKFAFCEICIHDKNHLCERCNMKIACSRGKESTFLCKECKRREKI